MKQLQRWAGPALGVAATVAAIGFASAVIGGAVAGGDLGRGEPTALGVLERLRDAGYAEVTRVEREPGGFRVRARGEDGVETRLFVAADGRAPTAARERERDDD